MTDAPIRSVLDELILDALSEDLDLVISYATSSQEAALRGDRKLLGVHVSQLVLCVFEVISKCKELAASARESAGLPP